MADNFSDIERKEIISKLLKVEKFQGYRVDQQVDLLRTHFLFFENKTDKEVKSYINQLNN